jgi:hypothetical protein
MTGVISYMTGVISKMTGVISKMTGVIFKMTGVLRPDLSQVDVSCSVTPGKCEFQA